MQLMQARQQVPELRLLVVLEIKTKLAKIELFLVQQELIKVSKLTLKLKRFMNLRPLLKLLILWAYGIWTADWTCKVTSKI